MDIITIVLIALGLAMDAFAVSIASGVIIKKNKLEKALLFGLMFGGFQMVMPIIGWAAGAAFRVLIMNFDHWIAFGLLVAIGIKMIYEALRIENIEGAQKQITGLMLLGLSIATSIDALAVGLSFAFLKVQVIFPALVIGIVTFFMSFAGIFLGSKYGQIFEKKIEIIGGLILVFIGFKILIAHLFLL